MQNLKNKKLNNDKGFSFLLVIVAMSFVAILIAIMLLISYQNYQMKHTGLKSEDNFYTAEQVLDEIKAGLQTDVSESVSDAYTYVLERYSETDGQDATRNWYFQTKYVDSLRSKLLASGSSDQFSTALLEGYLQKTKDGGSVEIGTDEDAGKLVANYSRGVILKGLKVTYTNEQGYVSIISTDLRLAIPAIDFTQSSSSPDLLEYCVVAENGIEAAGGVAGTPETLSGNVYAGTNGIQVANTTSLKIMNADRAIAKDGITLGRSSTFNFNGNALWTESIELLNSAVVADGNIFVKDDMSLNGDGGTVTMAGRYYGFSNPRLIQNSNVYNDNYIPENATAADLSSAIIINGKNSSLDFSRLNSIFIAGNSYINAELGVDDEQPLTVQMGESISVKGNQLAYLAPENAIVLPDNIVTTGGNPIINLPANTEVKLDVNVKLAELGNQSLSAFGIEPDDCQVYYRPGVTYVYMCFETDMDAANYFNAYYKDDINKYRDMFMSSTNFKMDPDTMSNVTLVGSAFENVKNTVVEEDDLRSAQAEANGYQDMFFAFCKKLVPTYTSLSTEEKNGTVFTNIVDVNALQTFLNSKGGKFVYTTPGTGLQAVLVDGDYSAATPTTGSTFSQTRLIVATGDVTFTEDVDYEGIVICGGKFTIGEGATLTSSPDEVSAVFQCVYYNTASGDNVPEANGYAPMSFFKDGKGYVLDGITSGVISGNAGSLIDLTDIILYENWKKQ